MPCGIIRESQRDSAPKPRIASRELPGEKRVGLKIARTPTQGSLADSATLGWRTQSLWDGRTTGLSGPQTGGDHAWVAGQAAAGPLQVEFETRNAT